MKEIIQQKIDVNRLEIQTKKFKEIDISNPFFDTFKTNYEPYFSEWYKIKKDDDIFVVEDHEKNLIAFMKLKVETEEEDYSDIDPILEPAKRLKICSFKVNKGYNDLGNIFINLAISQAMFLHCNEIYGTILITSPKIGNYFLRKGFFKHGIKKSKGLEEFVYIKKIK